MFRRGLIAFLSFPIFWAFMNFIGVDALRNVHVIVPNVVRTSDTVSLFCQYDLENEPLYTVKWYKGRDELFRYIPKQHPNKDVFDLAGIDVDLSRSGPNQIVLRHVKPEATGRYKCEVSTDAPNFETIMESGFMYVVDVPQGDVELIVDKIDLGNGQLIRANCTTPPSFPPMNITWFLNGVKINPQMSATVSPQSPHPKGKRVALATRSYVETELDHTFQPSISSNLIRLQCIASLFQLYRKEKVEYIEDDRPRPSSIVVADMQGQSSGSSRQTLSLVILVLPFLNVG